MRPVLVLLVVAGCERRAPIRSCEQDLSGEYAGDDRRWLVIDHGARIEAYPGFADVPAAGPLEVAPRMLELRRAADGTLRGETRRRYMQGTAACVTAVSAQIARCADDTLEVVHAETSPPLAFAPCRFGRTEPARVERWIRR